VVGWGAGGGGGGGGGAGGEDKGKKMMSIKGQATAAQGLFTARSCLPSKTPNEMAAIGSAGRNYGAAAASD